MDSGWFAKEIHLDEFDEFYENRIKELSSKKELDTWGKNVKGLPWPFENSNLKSLCRTVLFGKIRNCNCCGSYSHTRYCCQKNSMFCRQESSSDRFERYEKTNWYHVHKMITTYLRDNCVVGVTVKKILGDNRVNSFLEALTDKASQSFEKYTKREVREKGLTKPIPVNVGFIGFEEMQNDPWELYISNKMKEGDLGCLNFSALGF